MQVLQGARVIAADARARFPVLERFAYLNAGSVGPLSRRTARAMEEAVAFGLTEGRGRTSVWEGHAAMETALREKLGAIIHAPMEKLFVTTSTTEGCNLVITSLGLTPDDEVVTTDAEHPGLLQPLEGTGARIKKARVMERPASEALAAVLDEVTPATKLIALSHVLWLNGHVLPLADIKRETGLPLLVDGAQSVGAIPVDASVADWYTVSGQKWLCGPETTGALYVADHESMTPRVRSGYMQARTDAGRLALVHMAPQLIEGLLAAVEEFPEDGFERSAALVTRCRQALIDAGLEVRTEAGQGTLIAFRLSGDPIELVKRAEEKGVVIRSLPDGWLRASVGWWNDERDIDRLIAAVGNQAV